MLSVFLAFVIRQWRCAVEISRARTGLLQPSFAYVHLRQSARPFNLSRAVRIRPPGISGSGSLATFQLTALAAGTSSLSVSNVILLNSAGDDITATVQNGSVTVSDVPEPGFIFLSAAR